MRFDRSLSFLWYFCFQIFFCGLAIFLNLLNFFLFFKFPYSSRYLTRLSPVFLWYTCTFKLFSEPFLHKDRRWWDCAPCFPLLLEVRYCQPLGGLFHPDISPSPTPPCRHLPISWSFPHIHKRFPYSSIPTLTVVLDNLSINGQSIHLDLCGFSGFGASLSPIQRLQELMKGPLVFQYQWAFCLVERFCCCCFYRAKEVPFHSSLIKTFLKEQN